MFAINSDNFDDDVTSVISFSRVGSVVNILSGPPTDINNDYVFVKKFMSLKGRKVVCGGTTSNIVSKITKRQITVDTSYYNAFTPPPFIIQGIDLATEGAITLNRLYNIIDEPRELMNDTSPVTKLYDELMNADKIIFFIGNSNNATENSIDFIEQGIRPRNQIIPLIINELKLKEKLIVVEKI